jgi:hypothetical protein
MTRPAVCLLLTLIWPGVGFADPARQLKIPGRAKSFAYQDEAVRPVIAAPGGLADGQGFMLNPCFEDEKASPTATRT